MRSIAAAALALGLWLIGAEAQEPEAAPAPDLEFLEYLGAWAEDDDEWLAVEELERDDADPDEEPGAPESEDSEDDDESE